MSQFAAEELDTLLHGLLDRRLRDSSIKQLRGMLCSSAVARARYVEFAYLHSTLGEWARSTADPSISTIINNMFLTTALDMPPEDQEDSIPIPPLERSPADGASSSYSWLVCIPVAIIVVVMAVLLPRNGANDELDRKEVAVQQEPVDAPPEEPTNEEPIAEVEPRAIFYNSLDERFVARVVNVSDNAKWAEGAGPIDFMVRLNPGEALELLDGLAVIETSSGVRLLLQGHTRFTCVSQERGRLDLGKITALAETGQFTVLTPSAEIVDLGTEFAVHVTQTRETELAVLRGEVSVRGREDHPGQVASRLMGGGAAKISPKGKIEPDAQVNTDQFIRNFDVPSAWDDNRLSLSSVLCGGGLVGAINPSTGLIDESTLKEGGGVAKYVSDNNYHPSTFHPFIDGTFIVNQTGKRNQVDSDKSTHVTFKQTNGSTFGPIWAKRRTQGLPIATSGDFWERGSHRFIQKRLRRAEDGMIGLHANVGITYDLKKVATHTKKRVTSFTTTVANLDCMKELRPKEFKKVGPPKASFSVLIDGDYRSGRINFARDHKGVEVTVPISEDDRYLTLVSTQAGNSNAFDFVVLVDPYIHLSPR